MMVMLFGEDSGIQPGLTSVVALLALLAACPVGAAEQPYDRFYGRYEGEALSQTDDDLEKRDLKVKIGPWKDGFNVTWVAVTTRPGGKVKRKEYSINFQGSDRDMIYRSAMRKNLFGQAAPLDPLKGDPYVWARIDGDALIVYALLISEDAGYEMQTYVRRLIPEGLALEYSRVRDGAVLRTVTGVLKRR